MLEQFLQNIWSHSNKFRKFELTYKQIDFIKNIVLKELNLNDFYKLRDRLDGLNFYENAITRLAPFFYLQSIYDVMLPKTLLKNNVNDLDCCQINNEKFFIICFKFGETPIFNLKKNTKYLIFIRKGNRAFYFCGMFYEKVLDNTSKIEFAELEFDF